MTTFRTSLRIIVGGAGVAAIGVSCWVWWKVVSGPGDDNPIGMIAAVLACAALLPASGLIWAKRAPSWVLALWVLGSLPILAAAVLLAVMI